MAKASKNKQDKDKEILKSFTSATVRVIEEILEGITADEIIENTYMHFDDKDMDYLVR